MNILEKIIDRKKIEVDEAKKHTSVSWLTDQAHYHRTCLSLKDSILDPSRNGIIAEFKRASPSKGLINGHSTPAEVATAYEANNVSAISVLTDSNFFKGSLQDLQEVRKAVNIPVLRKEFIIDSHQLTEAKAYGADIILLIAACLDPSELEDLSLFAKDLGLNVLLEVHNLSELTNNLFGSIDAIGVNNRNLIDFSVSIQHSIDLVNEIPNQYIKVSESGISDPEIIKSLRSEGFQGFLIGENFMKAQDPAQAIKEFTLNL